jgi:hypothetical protein
MLAVPHGNDHRRVALELLVDTLWLDHNPGGLPYQTEVFGRHDPSRLLERAQGYETLHPGHWKRATGLSALGALIRFRIEQTVQMHNEVAHMSIVDGLLGLRLPG